MRKDHPLRKRLEDELEQLRAHLTALEASGFRILHREMGGTDFDVTEEAIIRTRYNIGLYEGILAED